MNNSDFDSIAEAVAQLEFSERGRQALRDLRTLFEHGGLGLDQPNQDAVKYLIGRAFSDAPGGVLDALRECGQ